MPHQHTHLAEVEFDPKLIARYDGSGPRYTSYPTADRFSEGPIAAQYITALHNRQSARLGAALSLYVHLPFCDTVCYYCACNKIATKDRGRADVYHDYLEFEIDYYNMLDQQQLPLAKGLVMTRDDEIRRAAIHDLLCQSTLDIPNFEQIWDIDFATYFAPELVQMLTLKHDGLVELTDNSVDITPRGRFLARMIAMRFDRHLREAKSLGKFSRVI
jgi:coproporphyrinogen III oxidase-like Fe-S oxidoreductase